VNGTATLQIRISNLWKLLFLFCRKYILRTSLAGFWPVPRASVRQGLWSGTPSQGNCTKRGIGVSPADDRVGGTSRDHVTQLLTNQPTLFYCSAFIARALECVWRGCASLLTNRVWFRSFSVVSAFSFLFCSTAALGQILFVCETSDCVHCNRWRDFHFLSPYIVG